MKCILHNIFLIFILICCSYSQLTKETVAKWNITKFLIDDEEIECKNCLPAGIKIYNSTTVFVSFPRWKEGVVATLGLLKFEENDNETDRKPIFEPWPSIDEQNDFTNASKLQSVLGFEILDDNIYVVDQGKVNNQIAIEDSIKVVKYNILTKECEHIYVFNKSIADLESSFLNDIVINPDNMKAYISNSGKQINESLPMEPSIIVVNLNIGEDEDPLTSYANAFKIKVDESTLLPDETFWLMVDGKKVKPENPMRTGVDGLALSCDYKNLYYSPLSSRVIYSIRVDIIDMDSTVNEIYKGYKGFASDGLAYSATNFLYMTDIENGAVHAVHIKNAKTVKDIAFLDSANAIVPADQENMWPDTLAIYDSHLYFVSNQLNYFDSGEIDFEHPKFNDSNFRIFRVIINEENYLAGCGGSSSSFGVVVMWVLIALLIMVILSFVLMSSHKQEEGVDKKMKIGLEQEEVE